MEWVKRSNHITPTGLLSQRGSIRSEEDKCPYHQSRSDSHLTQTLDHRRCLGRKDGLFCAISSVAMIDFITLLLHHVTFYSMWLFLAHSTLTVSSAGRVKFFVFPDYIPGSRSGLMGW
jgi:hypothetical protein